MEKGLAMVVVGGAGLRFRCHGVLNLVLL